jgi:hypothetical protein
MKGPQWLPLLTETRGSQSPHTQQRSAAGSEVIGLLVPVSNASPCEMNIQNIIPDGCLALQIPPQHRAELRSTRQRRNRAAPGGQSPSFCPASPTGHRPSIM